MKIIPSQTRTSAETSYCLDLMRGIAASLVVLGHARALLFYNFAESNRKDILSKLFYLVTGVGHEAVVVFFVLSGYLISLSIWRTHQKGDWSWSKYLIQRLARLWVVLIPALLLTLCWDTIGLGLTGTYGVYSALPQDSHIILAPVFQNISGTIFLGNLFFLQSIYFPSLGSNGPLWSLSYEFWYYVIFPAALLVFFAKKISQKLLWLTLVLLLCYLIQGKILAYFSLWLMGALVHHLPTPNLPKRTAITLLSFCSLILVALVSWHVMKVSETVIFLIGFATALVIWAVSLVSFKQRPFEAKVKGLSSWSYSLYLLHMPLLVCVHAVLFKSGVAKWQFSPFTLINASLIIAVAFIYSWSISLLTESHTHKFRTLLRSLWDKFLGLVKKSSLVQSS